MKIKNYTGFFKRNMFLIIIVFIILSSVQVFSLGISPGKISMNFVPNYVHEQELCFQTESFSRLVFEIEGPLKDYITLSEEEKVIKKGDNCISYKLELPEKLEKPGLNGAIIYALEKSNQDSEGIGVRVRVGHKIQVFVPYPGKYLEINYFKADKVQAGEEVNFVAEIESKGDELINIAKGEIFIYDKDDKLIKILDTNPATNIESNQKKYLHANWDSTGFEKGNYKALLKVIFDGLENNQTIDFRLGGFDVELLDYFKRIKYDGIQEFNVLVGSLWSEPLNVKARISLKNSTGGTVTSFETLTKNIGAWGRDKLTGYLNTDETGIGNFTAEITLVFEGEEKEYVKQISIFEEKKDLLVKEKSSGLSTAQIIMVGLGVLLIAMIILLIVLLVPKKKKK